MRLDLNRVRDSASGLRRGHGGQGDARAHSVQRHVAAAPPLPPDDASLEPHAGLVRFRV
jgi:hypothetical protein